MSTKQYKQAARSAVSRAKREGLTENHQSKQSDVTYGKRESEPVLGPPIVGKLWPDGIEVTVGFNPEVDVTQTRRSFGFRGRVSRRVVVALILTLTLIYAATHADNGKMSRLVKTVVKNLK